MAHIKVVSVTEGGAAAAVRLMNLLTGNLVERYDRFADASLKATQFSRFAQQAMVDCDMVLFMGQIDETIRLIAPYIANSGYDPEVLCVDEEMHNMVQLLKSQKADVNMTAENLAALAKLAFIA